MQRSAGPRLADVEIVFAAVATGALGPAAFIHEIAIAVALPQFRIAFRRGSERGKTCRRREEKYNDGGCSDPNMHHANPLLRY